MRRWFGWQYPTGRQRRPRRHYERQVHPRCHVRNYTELIAVNGNGAFVAVDSTYVYFTQENSVLASPDLVRIARTGGTSEVLTHLDYVANMLADANSIYIRTYDGILKVSKTGGSSTSFASISSMGLDAWLTQDATRVYAIDDDTSCDGHGAVYAFDKQTGAQTTIAGNLKCPNALALDSNYVYFVEQVGAANTDTALMRAPLVGGTPTQIARTSVNWSPGIALSGSYVYFAADIEPGDVTSGQALLRVPEIGGSVEQVLPCMQLITGIKSGSDGVYFANSYELDTNNGNSYTLVPSDGSSPRFEVTKANVFGSRFVVDGTTVFQADVQGVWATTHP